MDCKAAEKLFDAPSKDPIRGMAFDPNGNMYFTQGTKLYRWNKNDGCELWYSGDSELRGIAWSGNSLFACDYWKGQILKLNSKGEIDKTLRDGLVYPQVIINDFLCGLNCANENRVFHVKEFTDGTLAVDPTIWKYEINTLMKFYDPRGIAVYPWKIMKSTVHYMLLIADRYDNRIHCALLARDDGTHTLETKLSTLPKFNSLESMVGDKQGNVFVADRNGIWMVEILRLRPVSKYLISKLQGVTCLALNDGGDLYAAGRGAIWKIHDDSLRKNLDKVGQWKRLKLFLVGDGGAGKTSTLKWLMGEKFDTKPSKTNGADIYTTELRNWTKTSIDITEYMADFLLSKQQDFQPAVHSKENFSVSPERNKNVRSTHNELSANPVVTGSTLSTISASNNNDEVIEQSTNTPATREVFMINWLAHAVHKHREKLLTQDFPITFHIWDFGGQEVYYNTHHFFLTEAAIYLLVVDLTLDDSVMLSRFKFWLHSIRSYSPNAPIVIIGTHKDRITSDDETSKLSALYEAAQTVLNPPGNRHCFAISCSTVDEELRLATRRMLVELAEKATVDKKIPLRWIVFYHALELKSRKTTSGLTTLTLEEATTEARKCSLVSKTEMMQALQMFHQLGFLLYYAGNKELNQLIFMKPEELINVLRSVVTITKKDTKIQFGPNASNINYSEYQKATQDEIAILKQEGRLTRNRLETLWESYGPLIPQLRSLLQQFGLVVPDPNQQGPLEERDLIVPCLVETDSIKAERLERIFTSPQVIILKLDSAVQPLGLVSRLIVKALQLAQKLEDELPLCLLYRGGCAFAFEGIYIRLDITAGEIKLQLQHPKHNEYIVMSEVSKKLLEQLRTFLEEHKVKYTEHAICFQCKQVTFKLRKHSFTCDLCKFCSVVKSGKRFVDVVKYDKQWTELCLLLDQNKQWRELGDKLGIETLVLNDIERRTATGSPTEMLLKKWQNKENALMDILIVTLRGINQEAINLLQDWANEPTPQHQ